MWVASILKNQVSDGMNIFNDMLLLKNRGFMIVMKYSLKKVIGVIGLCLCFSWSAYADESNIEDFGDIDLTDIEGYEEEHGSDIFRDLVPSDLLPLLIDANITSPLINQTKAPVGRDILYLLPHKITALERGGLALYYFFNMTNRMRFTVKDLFAENTIDQIVQHLLAQPLPDSFSEFSSLIPLFKKLTIQERKTGILGQFGFVHGPWMFQVHTSLLLGERNFWLSKSDQQEIREIIARITGSQESALDESEFYRILVGLGDTRLKAGLNTINMPNFQMDIGVEGIIPTSEIFNSVDLNTDIHDIIESEVSLHRIKDNALPVLLNIRDYLVKPRLGNGGHFGFGCFMESKIGIFHDMAQLWMRLSYDKLLPAREDRLIMNKQTVTQQDLMDAQMNPNEDEIAEIENDFFEQYIFPPAYSVTVHPGGVINFIMSLSFDIKRVRCGLGYDFYAQQKERIKELHGADLTICQVRVDDAVSLAVRQHKVFSEVLYKFKTSGWSDMSLGIGGDYTISSKEIGRDWTLYLKFAASF